MAGVQDTKGLAQQRMGGQKPVYQRAARCPPRLSFVGVLLFALALFSHALGDGSVQGTLIVTDKDTPSGQEIPDDYLLRADDGSLYRLLFSGDNPEERWGSGQPISVQFRDAPPRATKLLEIQNSQQQQHPDNTLYVTSFEVKPSGAPGSAPNVGEGTAALPAPGGADGGNMADQISMVVFLMDMCGKGGGAAASPQDVHNFLFASGDLSLSSYYQQCSYGIAQLREETTLVLGPIPMPCSGTSKQTPWTTNSCTVHDYYGWMFYAEEWAAKQDPPIDLSRFHHRILITPPGQTSFMSPGSDACAWSGQAVIGPYTGGSWAAPDAYSYAWISGDYWANPQGWFHEIGHNYFLGHAGVPEESIYSDYSCAMGFCCKPRCMNPVHNWQLGWGRELDTTPDLMQPGETRQYDMPAQNHGPQHVLRLATPWARTSSLWMGYRVDTFPIDLVSLASGTTTFSNGVNIYAYPGESATDARNTMHVGQAARGRDWVDLRYGSDLVVRLIKADGRTASISVCRVGGAKEKCGAGVDFNCNGLVDADDPDCAEPPPPTPPPSKGKPPSSLPKSPPPRPSSSASPPSTVPSIPSLVPQKLTPTQPPDFATPPAYDLLNLCTSQASFDYKAWTFNSLWLQATCCSWCTLPRNFVPAVCKTAYDLQGNAHFPCASRPLAPSTPSPPPTRMPAARLTPSPPAAVPFTPSRTPPPITSPLSPPETTLVNKGSKGGVPRGRH